MLVLHVKVISYYNQIDFYVDKSTLCGEKLTLIWKINFELDKSAVKKREWK